MKTAVLLLTVGFLTATGCVAAQPGLKQAFQGKFFIGAALNESQFTEKNTAQAALIKNEFNTITAENVMKWEKIHPTPDQFDFSLADRFVEFGEKNGMFIVGHTLVWHEQTPAWVFEDGKGGPADRTLLLARLSNHIHTVVGRYQGRVKGWDVVNEALNENGSLRQTPWLKIIGEDYLVKAFEFARAADPAAELYYNDFALESSAKRKGALALIKKLQAAGVKVDGIGTQSHFQLKTPSIQQVEDTIVAFGELGVKVMVTELDVDVLPRRAGNITAEVSHREAADPALNPYANGLPDSVQQELTKRYGEIFAVYARHADKISRITLWGVSDGDSWLNHWPIRGRTNHPLLFDRAGQPKPAYQEVLKATVRTERPE